MRQGRTTVCGRLGEEREGVRENLRDAADARRNHEEAARGRLDNGYAKGLCERTVDKNIAPVQHLATLESPSIRGEGVRFALASAAPRRGARRARGAGVSRASPPGPPALASSIRG